MYGKIMTGVECFSTLRRALKGAGPVARSTFGRRRAALASHVSAAEGFVRRATCSVLQTWGVFEGAMP